MKVKIKRVIRILLLIVFLLLLFPSYILFSRIKNDYPLREYIKDKFIGQLKSDFLNYFKPDNKEELNINSYYIQLSDSSIAELNAQVESRMQNLRRGDANLLGTGKWSSVKAKLFYDLDTFNIKIRIRGDMPSNYNKGINNATLRINVGKGNAVNGKRKISIIRPELESGFYGFLFYKCFKEEGFLSNSIEIIRLYINGEYVGLRFLQEGFSKELIESSDRREGPILRFKNDCVDSEGRYNEYLYPELVAYKEKKILKDSVLSKVYSRALNKYDEFVKGNIDISNCFNIDEYAKFYALNDIFLSHHSNKCQNIKLYFNPINDKFEPIAWDPNSYERYNISLPILPGHTKRYGELCNDQQTYPLHFLFSKNDEFLKRYSEYLFKYSYNDNISKIIKKYTVVIKNAEVELFKQNFQENFSASKILMNIENIKKDFNQKQQLYGSYYVNGKRLEIRSICNIPIIIDSVKYKDKVISLNLIVSPNSFTEKVIVIPSIKEGDGKLKVYTHILGSEKATKYKAKIFSLKDNYSEILFNEYFDSTYFDIDLVNKVFRLKNKHLVLTKDLYIPDLGMEWEIESNTIIELKNSSIVCESTVYAHGSHNMPIIIKSDYTGGFIVKNAQKQSLFKNTHFVGLASPCNGNWNLTGAVTFYKSDVVIDSCLFMDNKSEDALNIVSCSFKLSKTTIRKCVSDALDVDFGQGSIKGVIINSCSNDALDFSGSSIEIKDVMLSNIGDKAISAGEKTFISGMDIVIDSSYIAVASKDSSLIKLDNVKIDNSKYDFVSYQKKDQYDKAKIIITNFKSGSTVNLIENGCELFLNDRLIKGNQENIYKMLYN